MSARDRFWTGAFDWRLIAFWWVAFSIGLPRHTFYTASAERGRPPHRDARPAQIDPEQPLDRICIPTAYCATADAPDFPDAL